MMKMKTLTFAFALSATATLANAADIGEVDTAFNLIGPNHKIKIVSFADPDVKGVSCFLSRPVTGGLMGGLGLAEDPSDVSIACRQTSAIEVTSRIAKGTDPVEVFNEKRSTFFKHLRVTRFYDPETSSFVYLTYSDKLIDGSPKNSISVVTPQEVIGGSKVKGSQLLPGG